eukprot:symbB.v1.2.006732.t1/scaffold406.1/size210851/2
MHLQDQLRQKVEGSVQEKAGLIIAVQACEAMDKGKLHEGTGLVMVPMKYSALVLQLFKNEVVDVEVTEVNELGFFAELGPARIFVSKAMIAKGWSYSQEDASARCFVSADRSQVIRRGTNVRVKLVATKQDRNRLDAIGTTMGQYLGPFLS